MIDLAAKDEVAYAQIEALPFWKGPLTLRPLVGGLTNKSYVADDATGRYVVRIGRDIPEHGVMQRCVLSAMRAASDGGVAPSLRFARGAVTVSDFIDGGHLRADDMRDGSVVAALVMRMRELHASGGRIGGALPYFWPFQVVRNYASFCSQNGSRLDLDVEVLARHASWLEELVSPFHPVFTHNDLVPQNVMRDGSGALFLIDWDYSGYGHPLFDVAALTANIDADDEQAIETEVLTLYAGAVDANLWKQFRIFKLIINLRETLWGAVQDLVSDLDQSIVQAGMASIYPDEQQGYAGYAEMNRRRFYRNLATFNDLYG